MKKYFWIVCICLTISVGIIGVKIYYNFNPISHLTIYDKSNENKTEIRLLSNWNYADNKGCTYQKIISKFNESHKDIFVYNDYVWDEEYYERLKADFSSENEPDIFISWPGQTVSTFVSNDKIVDLNPLLTMDDQWFESIDKSLFKYIVTDGGSVWGLPVERVFVAMFVNTDVLEGVGLKPAQTYDELIDKENEKVYLKYGSDYVINLKNDEVRNYNKQETDIGTISTEGEPSKYNETCARNSQKKYKLISGEDEKIVNGFLCNEYYYAAMLPLKETFEFLNIKYSFENDVLTIDTSEARPFAFEATEEKTNFMGDEPIEYLYVDKVILNGAETEITYKYSSGHFENMHTDTAKARSYVCNGKVYINDSFISRIVNRSYAFFHTFIKTS